MHYLHRRDGVYYYRQRLPKEIGSGSITKSLKTKDHPTAKHLLKQVAYNVSLLFMQCKGGTVSLDRIRNIVSQYIDEVLKEHERTQAQNSIRSPESIADYLKTLENAQSDIREALVTNNQRQAEANLQFFIETSSNPPAELQDIPQGTTEYRELLREILKADVEIGEEVIRRTKGDYSSDFNQSYGDNVSNFISGIRESVHKSVNKNTTPEQSSKLASEALKEFLQDRTTGRSIGAKMVSQYDNSISLLIEILGDRPVTDYTRSDLIQAREIMLKLPSNMRKSAKTRDKTIAEIVAMKLPPRNRNTVDQALVSIVSFFGWLEVQSYIPKSIAKDIRLHKPKGAKKDTKKSVPFTSDMLQVLFSSPTYTTKLQQTLRERPERIFVPLLSLFHGARLNELCQLHNPDIIERDGLVCLSISGDDATKKRTKPESSIRVIPMHSKLIEAGLMEYLKRRRQDDPKGQLWSNLTYTPKNGYMRQVSYWFNKELDRLGLKKDQRLTFHSFRHTVMDILYNRKAKIEHIQAIVGHDQGDYAITLSYGGGLSPSTLQETMEVISYDAPAVDRLIQRLKEILTESSKTL